jgi:hypothetical protein
MGTFVESVEARLRETDVTQVATLVFAALVLALVTVWPSSPRSVNESWYAFAQTRGVVLALLALGFGASAAREVGRRGVATAAVVVLIALLALPFEVAAYAATYPATPLWWSLVTIVVAPGAYFVLGLALGGVAARLRLGAFLPLLVPAVLVGFLMLDVRLGWSMFNPLTAPLDVSTWHAVAMSTLAAVMIAWAWRRWRVAAPEVSP